MKNGCLILGGMHIGNSKDLSFRMLEIIPSADIVLAENVDFFIDLCKEYNLSHTDNIILLQYDGSHVQVFSKILESLKDNKRVLMVSDCGMPTITDPGREMVNMALENNIEIIAIPGPNVAITALSLSGFLAENFHYYGYLPKVLKEKISILKSSKNLQSTIIFLESQNRILETLDLVKDIFEKETLIFIGVNMTMENEKLIYGDSDHVYKKISELLNDNEFIRISVCIDNAKWPRNNPKYWTDIE